MRLAEKASRTHCRKWTRDRIFAAQFMAVCSHHFVPRGVEQLLLPVIIEAHIIPVGVHNRVLPLEITLPPCLLVVARPLRHRPLLCDEQRLVSKKDMCVITHILHQDIRRARKKTWQCLFLASTQIQPKFASNIFLPTSRFFISNRSEVVLWILPCTCSWKLFSSSPCASPSPPTSD